MTTRQYTSRSQQSTLTGAITAGTTSMTVVNGSNLLGTASIAAGTTFTLVIDPDTALEEIVDATAVSTNTFTITRAIDGSSAQAHSAGAVVRHMAIGRDYRDANLHAEADASYNDGAGSAHTMHGIASGEGVVVGTLKTQTLTNKTLTSPTISNPTITGTSGVETSIVFEGSTADAYETTLTVVDPTQDNTITLPNTTGTVVIANAVQTLTNKTMGDALNAGGFRITNIATPVDATDAVNKTFADAQVAAAATSAASAATSASSAATSASSALTSANSASTSASSALTSANSAATSASTMAASVAAAATSAASAATSATAAATSATSAAASATAAATSASSASTSASSALTSANSAATSATAAATSETNAAASATAAATSASSASTSASSALTSANSAATSATAAATSATSAAASATAAAASYDSFDDRYLGPKSTAPTVDNDGNPLTSGVIYFNTTDGNMYVYDTNVPGWVVFTSSGDITSVTAGTGLSGGGTSGSVTLNLANTAVTAGSYTYTSLTVDAQGRITAASNGTTSGFALTSGKLSQFAATTSAELAGVISNETGSGSLVFATSPTLVTPVLGTPTSVTLTNATGLPVTGITASTTAALGVGSIELGHATDTTIARVSAGVVSIEGVNVVTTSSTDTLTNKTLTSPTVNGAFTNSVNEIIARGFEEDVNVVASAATGTINFDVATASIWYYTSNATANHTLNFRYNSTTSLSSKLAVGDAITLVWLNTNGATAYYPNVIQIDGSAVTPKVPAAISAGNASAIDAYVFTIIKTAATPTYTVLETQTKFA